VTKHSPGTRPSPAVRRLPLGLAVFLLVELYDELGYSLATVALPFVRNDLGLTYGQVGLLLGLPILVATLIEPFVLLLGDTPVGTRVVVAGGMVLAAATLLAGLSSTFALLLAAFILTAPASGAFVSLSQALLIARHRQRESQTMARWTAAGTIGDLLGPAVLGAFVLAGQTWRQAFLTLGAAGLGLTIVLARHLSFPRLTRGAAAGLAATLRENLRGALRLRRLRRWVLLLPLSDLMLDVFFGYLPLFLADIASLPPASAALGATLWLVGFLAGQVFLGRSLPRPAGVRLLRWSAAATVLLYPVWLLAPAATMKLLLLPPLGLLASPWYPVLQGEAYATAPDRTATVAALTSVSSSLGGVFAVAVGAAAARVGLPAAMTLLAIGPLALLLFTPSAPEASDAAAVQS